MAEINLNTNINNAITNGYNQKSDIQKNVAVGVNPESASAFNASVMSGRSAVRPVSNNEGKPNSAQTSEKEAANPNKESKKQSSKSIQLEFDKGTGYPVIKFRDTKGNVVSQVPPEQFLKMRSVVGYNSRKEEIVDKNDTLYSRKVGDELQQQGSTMSLNNQKTNSEDKKDNGLSLYI